MDSAAYLYKLGGHHHVKLSPFGTPDQESILERHLMIEPWPEADGLVLVFVDLHVATAAAGAHQKSGRP